MTLKTLPDKAITVSVDAMGGDQGAGVVVAGISRAARKQPNLRFIVHGPEAELREHLRKRKLSGIAAVRHSDGVVAMHDKPSQVMRHGKGTSMWSAIDTVKTGEAQVCVSCGNTGALMAVSMVRLRKLPGVNRPAIAVLWPAHSSTGSNIVLDVGADVRADEDDLVQYALMGASYARNGFGLARPRVGLLNVGTEEHKGRAELRAAHDLLLQAAEPGLFDFVGFVEGVDIPSDRVDVIVTDGFTGNVAIKSAEGTASFIGTALGQAFRKTPLSRLAALMAATSLRRMRKRIDPRRVNGGVFLGLNGTVVKSHGSADAVGVAAAIRLAAQLAAADFSDRLAARIASASGFHDDDAPTDEATQ
ncbi:MAG: phosphate acyltransferase PlsX [Pseudomonadota bacterium]